MIENVIYYKQMFTKNLRQVYLANYRVNDILMFYNVQKCFKC